MRILIIEDDSSLRNMLRVALGSEGYNVDDTDDGAKGSYAARTQDYDLILLDSGLPTKTGKQVAEDIRNSKKNTKIILMSIRSEVDHKVDLLELTDDYIVKPFTFSELFARIKAILRRPYEITPNILHVEDYTIDVTKHKVMKGEKVIRLTRKEFGIFECLGRQKGSLVTRTQIMEKVWNSTLDPFSNTVETHIRNLRLKIRDSKQKVIKTVQGHGYMIEN